MPYIQLLRIDKPIGFFLLMLPSLWGVALSGNNYYIEFIIGSFLMRSAGCIINDLADIEFDKKVKRTLSRPLASNSISIKKAFALLFALLISSLFILLRLEEISIYIGLFSMLLVIIYPFMKRITYWPQAFLGITFNVGILMGNADIDISILILYLGAICWTIGYDTIYAYQDIEDDIKIGVKSTAIKFADSKKYLIGFYSIFSIALIVFGVVKNYEIYFFPITLAIIHLYYQIYKLDIKNNQLCLNLFKSNWIIGMLIFFAIAAENLI